MIIAQNHSSAWERALQGYADGSLPCALHALVGAHVEMNEAGRAQVQALEHACAQVDLAEASPCAIAKRADRLAAILCKEPLPRGECCREARSGWPRSLRHYLGEAPEKLPFRRLLPGIAECRLKGDDQAEALLYKVRGGARVPEHAHEGEEFTLVLSGALIDNGRRYGPGDVNVGDDSAAHAPHAEPGQECLCFVVLTGPLRLTGPVGRLFNRFMRR